MTKEKMFNIESFDNESFDNESFNEETFTEIENKKTKRNLAKEIT